MFYGVNNMSENGLHPTVTEFKSFINKHPKLIEEIRKSGRSWQEYYEKWVLLGEDDPMWEKFIDKKEKSSQKKSELFNQIMKLTENIDLEKVQGQVQQLSGTISTLQELLGTFQETKRTNQTYQNQPPNWFRD